MSIYGSNYYLEFISRVDTDNPNDLSNVSVLSDNIISACVIPYSIIDLSFTIQGALTKQLRIPKDFFDINSSQSNIFFWNKKPSKTYIPLQNDIVRIFVGSDTSKLDLVTVCSIRQRPIYNNNTRMYTIDLRDIISEGEDRVSNINGTQKKRIDKILKESLQQQNNTTTKMINNGGYSSYIFNLEFGNDFSEAEKRNLPEIQLSSDIRTLRDVRAWLLKSNNIYMFYDYINEGFLSNNITAYKKPSTKIDIVIQKQLKKDGKNARPIYKIDDTNIYNIVQNTQYNIIQGRSIQNSRLNPEVNPRIPITRQYYYHFVAGTGKTATSYWYFSDLFVNMTGQYGYNQLIQAPTFAERFTDDEQSEIEMAFIKNDTNAINSVGTKIVNMLNQIAQKECERDVYRDAVYDVSISGTLAINQDIYNMLYQNNNKLTNYALQKNNPSKIETYWKIGMVVKLDLDRLKELDTSNMFNLYSDNMVILNINANSISASDGLDQRVILSLAPDLYEDGNDLTFSSQSILSSKEKQELYTTGKPLTYITTKETKIKTLTEYQETRSNIIDKVMATINKNLSGTNFTSSLQNDFYTTQRKLRFGR